MFIPLKTLLLLLFHSFFFLCFFSLSFSISFLACVTRSIESHFAAQHHTHFGFWNCRNVNYTIFFSHRYKLVDAAIDQAFAIRVVIFIILDVTTGRTAEHYSSTHAQRAHQTRISQRNVRRKKLCGLKFVLFSLSGLSFVCHLRIISLISSVNYAVQFCQFHGPNVTFLSYSDCRDSGWFGSCSFQKKLIMNKIIGRRRPSGSTEIENKPIESNYTCDWTWARAGLESDWN